MKKNLLTTLCIMGMAAGLQAQITQLNNNQSLHFNFLLSNSKAVYVSGTDNSLWVTDGSLAGTFQLSAAISFVESLGPTAYLNGKLLFAGKTAATGVELYITDGTIAGTVLLKDINPGAASSSPDDATTLNGYIYFSAETVTEGRELWRSDGTTGGTTLVKDIMPGTTGSNYPGKYHLFSTSTYLLFMANTATQGVELWRSDGTPGGTTLLKDINTNGSDSSGVLLFSTYNNKVLFIANDFTHGYEPWITDGTSGGTNLVKDIVPGTVGSKALFSFGFIVFNNRAFFSANDGVNGEELWGTNGTDAGTSLLKDIEPGLASSVDFIVNAVVVGSKFIFTATNTTFTRRQLWESDGTTANTRLFKNFDGADFPFTFPGYNPITGGQVLFQGNKFFFAASTAAEGYELWVSDGVDGTVAHTHIVKDINAGAADGIESSNLSYTYTATAIYFPANNTTNGLELWKSDGTNAGTTMVADLVTGTGGSDPQLDYSLVNNKILFEANNGDDPVLTDLYAVNGTFTPLPVLLTEFTVSARAADALLNWRTAQEINSKSFTVERSFDGAFYQPVGTTAAAGNSSTSKAYFLTDAGIMNSGQALAYYRLVSTDIDGKQTLSPVITLKIKNAGNWNVRLLSSPANENIKVLLSGITQKIYLSVIDISGKKLYTSSLSATNGQLTLNTNSLPHGSYVLLAETSGETKSIQFVK